MFVSCIPCLREILAELYSTGKCNHLAFLGEKPVSDQICTDRGLPDCTGRVSTGDGAGFIILSRLPPSSPPLGRNASKRRTNEGRTLFLRKERGSRRSRGGKGERYSEQRRQSKGVGRKERRGRKLAQVARKRLMRFPSLALPPSSLASSFSAPSPSSQGERKRTREGEAMDTKKPFPGGCV